jgi:hypothetical protein
MTAFVHICPQAGLDRETRFDEHLVAGGPAYVTGVLAMSARDEYRKTALKYFIAAEAAADPDTVHRMLESGQGWVRIAAAVEGANYHALARRHTGRRGARSAIPSAAIIPARRDVDHRLLDRPGRRPTT